MGTVTWLSRTLGVAQAHAPAPGRIFGRFSLWHGLCIFLTQSGCFYTLPFIEVEDNVPPEIRITSPAEGDTLVISSTTAFAYVTAEDPDDDTLLCKWFVEGYEDLGSGKPIIDEDLPGCYINVNNDPLYDGRTLRCIIYDAAFDSDEITWPIDVLQEGT